MTPEKEIKNVVTRMARVTEQQIVQRMHDFNDTIEARRSAANPTTIVESGPPAPAESRIQTSEQRLERRGFILGTGAQQATGGGGSSGGGSGSVQIIVNVDGTPTYMQANGTLGDEV